MELHEKIAEVRRVQLERGHCKGFLEDSAGHVCLRGAIGLALEKTAYRYSHHMDVDRFLHRLAAKNDWPPVWGNQGAHVVFNNDPNTTPEDIDNFLQEAEIAAKELMHERLETQERRTA